MIRILTAFLPVALAVSLLAAPQPVAPVDTEPVAAYTAAAVAPRFADPHWYPLRKDAKLRCVFSQCIGTPEYPALDLASAVNVKGEPVHAAGKGRFHVGDTGAGCFNGDQTSTRGNWAWVDHGGGVVSRYHHLDTVRAGLEGKIVGPATVIGTMGQSGSKCGDTFYLHFETRRGGVNGKPYPYHPGALRICTPTKTVYPRALGQTKWDNLARDTIVPGGTSDCYTDPVTPAAPTSTSTTRGSTWARLRWATGTEVIGATVHRQEYQVAAGVWGLDTYRYLGQAAATNPTYATTVWKDVTSVRRYRARVAFRNANGHSEWTPWRELIGPPGVPRHNDLYPQAGKTNVRYAWKKSYENGTPVTGYLVARRMQRTDGTWTGWTNYNVGADTYYIRWDGLVSNRVYAMRVLARSAAGPSPWKKASAIRTLR